MTDDPRISAHTAAEGWPFNPGEPVWWHDAHSQRHEGFYLRLDIDDLEDCWGNEAERQEFISRMEGSDSACTECGAEADEEGDLPCDCEPFEDHPQADSIRFQAAYGIAARVLPKTPARIHDDVDGTFLKAPDARACRAHLERLLDKDPDDFDITSDVPLNQLFPVKESLR